MLPTESDLDRRFLRWLVLCSSVALIAARPFSFPETGLDPSWKTALLLARVNDLKWGSSLNFTYGPWGWLSVDSVIDRSLMAMSIMFALGVSALLVAVSWKLLRASFSEPSSLAIVLLIIVPVFAQVGLVDVFLAGIFGSFLFIVNRAQDGIAESWRTILPITFAVALVLQVKFSAGLFAVIGLVVLSAIWWRSLKTFAVFLSSFVAWFLLLWLLSERSLSGLPDWTLRSVSIGGGYADAISASIGQPIMLFLFGVFSVATIALLVHRLRCMQPTRTITVVSSLLIGLMLYAGLKTGFIREENSRIFEAISLAIPAWIWMSVPIRAPIRRFALLLVPVVLGLAILTGERPSAGTFAGLYNWPDKASTWIDDANLLTSKVVFDRKADVARNEAQAIYGLSEEMVGWLRSSPAQIDPFETTLIWAYDLPWRPLPVFQPHVYTPLLDEANTKALASRNPNDTILIDTEWVGNLDFRLSLWTSPRYQLELTCSWVPIKRDGRWEQWAKGTTGDQCGTSEVVSSEQIDANQKVAIPNADIDSFLVAVYESDPSISELLSNGFNLLYKPLDILTVQLGDREIRQPRAFSGDPLIVSCPANSPATDRYKAVCPSPSTITFSESGTLRFERIPIRSR